MSGAIEYKELYDYAGLFAGSDGHIYTVVDSEIIDGTRYVTLAGVKEYTCGHYATVRVMRRYDCMEIIQNVHTLVCEAFNGKPRSRKGLHVRHLNGNSRDNRPCNLAYGTPRDNWEDKILVNTATIGEKNGRAKLTNDQRREVYDLYAEGCSQKKIAEQFGVTQGAVSKIIKQCRKGGYAFIAS